MTIKEAIEESCCDLCIIYYGNGIGYYQGEETKGSLQLYLLLEKGKKLEDICWILESSKISPSKESIGR